MAQIFEGKTTNEAIEKGLKELKTTKDKVNIKIIEEEEKRSFFSILTPRIVKVEMTLKEEKKPIIKERNVEDLEKIDFDKATENVKEFLNKFVSNLQGKDIKFDVKVENYYIVVNIDGDDLNYLIGYRGDVLNNLQTILTAIASKGLENKAKVTLNICGYRQKREKSLEELAEKLAHTVIKTKKKITLEPMSAYERKIIHTKLQNNSKVETTSIGEEPYRKVVISLKK